MIHPNISYFVFSPRFFSHRTITQLPIWLYRAETVAVFPNFFSFENQMFPQSDGNRRQESSAPPLREVIRILSDSIRLVLFPVKVSRPAEVVSFSRSVPLRSRPIFKNSTNCPSRGSNDDPVLVYSCECYFMYSWNTGNTYTGIIGYSYISKRSLSRGPSPSPKFSQVNSYIFSSIYLHWEPIFWLTAWHRFCFRSLTEKVYAFFSFISCWKKIRFNPGTHTKFP